MRHLKKQEESERIDALLCEQQAALRQLSYGELIGMPSHAQRPVSPEGQEATLSTWRDEMPDQTVRIVTQYFRPGFLGSARVRAKGFLIDTRGVVRELIESELWDFT